MFDTGKIKLSKGPHVVALLYFTGMLSLILGLGSLIVTIDPRPLPSSSWQYFLILGIFLSVAGCFMLSIILKAFYSRSFFIAGPLVNETTSSAVDLLNETQSLGCSDSPVVELRSVNVDISDFVPPASQCIAASNPSTNTRILFYKETFV